MKEINIDCLSGPTHHFGGLAYGNIASTSNQASLSNPQQAALEGLEKMKLLADLGIPQIILPPHPRPDYSALRSLGFRGSDHEVIEEAFRKDPRLLLICSSSSAMWAANSATTTPSIDSADHKVNITPANLASNLHRSIEVPFTTKILRQVFHNKEYFTHHSPLFASGDLFDEGAANHTRFSSNESEGIHLFVYGKSRDARLSPKIYPARQTREAQEAICRLHGIHYALFIQQNPLAIDEGVFHNDVISTGYQNIFFYHEEAFLNTEHVIDELQNMAYRVFKEPLFLIKIKRSELSLKKAVESYLFNSQIVKADGKLFLIAPMECKKIALPKEFTPIFVPLYESMKNGGGPACLRLRMQVTEKELSSIHPGVFLTDSLYEQVKKWITSYYRTTFYLEDLLNKKFLKTNDEAHDEIMHLLSLS